MPKVDLSRRAKRDLKKLPKHEQRAIFEALKALQEDPRHNSLRTGRHRATGHFKSRASDELRILWYFEGDMILVVRVGGHEIIE